MNIPNNTPETPEIPKDIQEALSAVFPGCEDIIKRILGTREDVKMKEKVVSTPVFISFILFGDAKAWDRWLNWGHDYVGKGDELFYALQQYIFDTKYGSPELPEGISSDERILFDFVCDRISSEKTPKESPSERVTTIIQ